MTPSSRTPEARRRALPACLALILTAASAAADNWPSFRGENGSGVGRGSPPHQWNIQTGQNIRWKQPIEGLALSSPIIWQDKLFLTTAVGSNPDPEFKHDPTWGYRVLREKDEWTFKVICLDKGSGKRRWEKVSYQGPPKQGRHSESSYANPTPATDGRHLLVSFGSHGVFCYDLQGKLLWQRNLGTLSGAPKGNSSLDWGYSSSPIIHQDMAIVQCDTPERAFIAVLDLATGEERFRIRRNGRTTWSTPTVARVGDRNLLICNGYENTAAFDLRDGRRIWWLHGRGDIPVPRPVLAGDSVIITAAHGGRSLHSVRLDARGDLTPTPGSDKLPPGLNWWSARLGSYIPTPLYLDGILYVCNERGIASALDARTGEAFYTERLSSGRGAWCYGSPVSAGGKLFIPRNDGTLHVIRIGRKFQRLAEHQFSEALMTTPAISEGRLFIRTRRHLYCIGE